MLVHIFHMHTNTRFLLLHFPFVWCKNTYFVTRQWTGKATLWRIHNRGLIPVLHAPDKHIETPRHVPTLRALNMTRRAETK